MKTSDKLLLSFCLVFLGLVGILHLALYAEYKEGHIISAKELHEEQYEKLPMSRPRYLSLRGTIWVNILPSADSCYIELPKKPFRPDEGYFKETVIDAYKPGPRYRQIGDTLLLYGDNDRPIHRPFVGASYQASVPVINVYCPTLEGITVRNGQVMLKGSIGASTPVSFRLRVENATVWIGERVYNQNELLLKARQLVQEPEAQVAFDSLDLESLNSVILLNGTAHVHSLHIRLDSASELNDQHGLADQLLIESSPASRINLTGENLKRTRLTVH
jgi:hypothetical protein